MSEYRSPKKSGDNYRRGKARAEQFRTENGKNIPAVRKSRKGGFKPYSKKNTDSMFGPDIEDYPRSGEGFTVR